MPTYTNFAMEAALERSLALQAHYAFLLNIHDGGSRRVFKTVDEWISRLRETGAVDEDVLVEGSTSTCPEPDVNVTGTKCGNALPCPIHGTPEIPAIATQGLCPSSKVVYAPLGGLTDLNETDGLMPLEVGDTIRLGDYVELKPNKVFAVVEGAKLHGVLLEGLTWLATYPRVFRKIDKTVAKGPEPSAMVRRYQRRVRNSCCDGQYTADAFDTGFDAALRILPALIGSLGEKTFERLAKEFGLGL